MNSREAFERKECKKYSANYEEMKEIWDWNQSQFGYRYGEDSLRGQDWIVWNDAWQARQPEVDEMSNRAETIALDQMNTAQYNYQLEQKVNELEKQNKVLSEQVQNLTDGLVVMQEERNMYFHDAESKQKRIDSVNRVLINLKSAGYMSSENKKYNEFLIEKLEKALRGGQ